MLYTEIDPDDLNWAYALGSYKAAHRMVRSASYVLPDVILLCAILFYGCWKSAPCMVSFVSYALSNMLLLYPILPCTMLSYFMLSYAIVMQYDVVCFGNDTDTEAPRSTVRSRSRALLQTAFARTYFKT